MSIGERVELPATSDARGLPAYAALPPGASRGIVVLHEIMGLQPEIERVVEKFAERGWAALAPDFFSCGFKPACIYRVMRASMSGEGEPVRQLEAARAWLCERAALETRDVALIGFCLGGGFALAAGRGWGAVSANYGTVPAEELLAQLPPTIACYGGRDRIFGTLGARLERGLQRGNVPHEVHTFPDAGHSLLTDGHHPVTHALTRPFMAIAWNEQVAEEGWRRIFSFLDRYVPG